jgi:hypothetical protein
VRAASRAQLGSSGVQLRVATRNWAHAPRREAQPALHARSHRDVVYVERIEAAVIQCEAFEWVRTLRGPRELGHGSPARAAALAEGAGAWLRAAAHCSPSASGQARRSPERPGRGGERGWMSWRRRRRPVVTTTTFFSNHAPRSAPCFVSCVSYCKSCVQRYSVCARARVRACVGGGQSCFRTSVASGKPACALCASNSSCEPRAARHAPHIPRHVEQPVNARTTSAA